jgi:hypothetical protein
MIHKKIAYGHCFMTIVQSFSPPVVLLLLMMIVDDVLAVADGQNRDGEYLRNLLRYLRRFLRFRNLPKKIT